MAILDLTLLDYTDDGRYGDGNGAYPPISYGIWDSLCQIFWVVPTILMGLFYRLTTMAGMILRESEKGKKYVVRVDMGMTTMKCCVE